MGIVWVFISDLLRSVCCSSALRRLVPCLQARDVLSCIDQMLLIRFLS